MGERILLTSTFVTQADRPDIPVINNNNLIKFSLVPTFTCVFYTRLRATDVIDPYYSFLRKETGNVPK